MKIFEDDFWGRVKKLCAQNGMSMKGLSEVSGVNYHTINNSMRINRIPKRLDIKRNIAKALGTSVDYLMTGKSEKSSMVISSLPEDVRQVVQDYRYLDDERKDLVRKLVRDLTIAQIHSDNEYRENHPEEFS